ncbi:AAA family ATPase [Bacillus cereus]|uniref:AAA family ATPase n=1 Tax=Bacillus cereus TaxID=1396 RepID=UPI00350E45C0
MELLYLWVENLQEGLMKEQGFNFDNRYKYQLKQRDNKNFELYIKPNSNYIENFFQLEEHSLESVANIKNITAVVGQNGAGKSSVVDFLKENFGIDELIDREEEGENERYLYILREYKNKRMEHYICFSKEMRVDIKPDKGISYFYERRIGSGLPRNLKDTTLIYFSNVYDNKEEYISEKMLNISTNHLSSSFSRLKSNLIQGEGVNFKFQEVKRQIRFIQVVKKELKQFELPFKLPDQIDLIFVAINNTSSVSVPEEKIDVFQSLKKIGTSITRNQFRTPEDGEEREFIRGFAKCIINHLFYELSEREIKNKIKGIPFQFFQDKEVCNCQNDFNRLIDGIKRLSKLIENEIDGLEYLAKMLQSLATFMSMFYNIYRHRVSHHKVKRIGRREYKFSFNLEDISGREFEEFIELYESSCVTDEFINFSWKELSSGQKALLNIYSRFYFVSKRPELIENPKDDLIILIDEGEVYLHPHWQGKFLNSLIEYFPVVFRNSGDMKQRNIQLILTSNSPFIVSDLPGTNVIFLRKEGENTVIIDNLEEYHQTFAANIHSLLAHSFFMEDGVTGAFAKRKINEIIHMLINEDLVTIFENEEKIEKTINLIGEPVIRNKLLQMLAERRMTGVNKEIARLNLRLKKLEKWQDDKN